MTYKLNLERFVAKKHLLQHRIGAQLIEHRRIRHAQHPIDNVHVAVHLRNVRLDDGRIHAAALHGDRLVTAAIRDHIEVEILAVGHRRELRDLKFVNVCVCMLGSDQSNENALRELSVRYLTALVLL